VLEQHGSPPDGIWTFGIPLEHCRPFDWHGERATPGDIIALPSGWELDAVSYGGFEIATFSVAEEHLALLAPAERRPTPSSSILREKALTRALAHIEQYGDESFTVEELCLATGASLRTLRRAFGERFSVSPKAYLQAYRLNGARRALRRSEPASTKVADVAGGFGFWHMGKFAADYRRQFGELPSRTLAGARESA